MTLQKSPIGRGSGRCYSTLASLSKQLKYFFQTKKNKSIFPPLNFNGIPVKQVDETQHLGMILDSNLSFNNHLENKIAKANQGLGVMIQLKKWLSFRVLETIYKLYVRPHLDYGDVLYHTANPNKNETFELSPQAASLRKVEEVQYKAAKIITGAWQGTSMEKTLQNSWLGILEQTQNYEETHNSA